MNAHSFVAPMAHDFNSAEWLARFEAVGGGYTLSPDNEIHLGFFVLDRSDEDQRAARRMIDALTQAERQALREHLIARRVPCPDLLIVTAWEAYVAARGDLNAMDDELLGRETEQDARIWKRADAAEDIIYEAIATTNTGVEIKLWLALCNLITDRTKETAALARDIDALRLVAEDLDWTARVVFSAIASLRAMEG